jgi:hypothetical protein
MRTQRLIALGAFGIVALGGCAIAAFWLVGSPASLGQDADKKAETKKVPIGSKKGSENIFLEVNGENRRVLVNAYVCLRQGQLEQLLTRKRTKEHEAILAADIDARDLHKALLLAKAEPGSPVQFQPKFKPPTGTAIKVTLEYQDKGKTVRRPAGEWIRDVKTKKTLTTNWVFAGSRLFQDPQNPNAPPEYLANSGDVICIANFDTALLDLPFDSTKDNEHLTYEANTDAIPALETAVTVILEPILPVKAPAAPKKK